MACGNLELTLVGETEDFADRGWYVKEQGGEEKI